MYNIQKKNESKILGHVDFCRMLRDNKKKKPLLG